jgi:uncharacterized protein YjeT (DUF2065 family)
MKKTRLSLFYLAGYLSVGGIGFLFFPKVTLTLFFSNGNYSDVMVRIMGVFLLSLALIVIQIIRHRATFLYPTTLVVRALILSSFTLFYILYRDPMLLVLLAIVGIGFLMTLTSYLLDRRNEKA